MNETDTLFGDEVMQARKLEKPEDLFKMKLLEKLQVEDMTIICVPGGWIFQLIENYEGEMVSCAVFVKREE